MPRHITKETRAEAVRLRIENRLTAPQIATALGISNFSAYHLTADHPLSAEEMSERRRKTLRAWKPDEIKKLRQLWPSGDRQAIEKALPRRKWQNISRKACDIGIYRPRVVSNKRHRRIDPLFIELRAIREARRITRDELADRIGIHRILLANYELGICRPSWFNFRAWVQALGLAVEIR